MSLPARTRTPGDDGAVLVLVLVFVVVVGLLAVALQQQATAGLTSTRTTTLHESRFAAVNSGVDSALAALRGDGALCSTPGAAPVAIAMPAINGHSATVSCTALGTGSGAVFITDTSVNGYIRTEGASPSPATGPRIEGPVVNNGTSPNSWSVASGLRVSNGDVTQRLTPTCPGAPTAPTGLELVGTKAFGAYQYRCETATAATPALWSAMTTLFAGAQPANAASVITAGSGSGRCTTFRPGRHTAVPNLDDEGINYFQTGVYYFDNVGPIIVGPDSWVVGGEPGPGEVRRTSVARPNNCTLATVPTAGTVPLTAGVVFVLGGNSRIVVTGTDASNAGRLELFSPRSATAPGVAGSSVLTVPSGLSGAWGGGEASNLAITTPVVSVTDADNRTCGAAAGTAHSSQVVIHGQVYVPGACVLLGVTGSVSMTELRNGLVAGRLDIRAQGAIGQGAGVLIAGRRTVMVSSVSSQTATQKALTARVLATVANDEAHTIDIASWAMENP